MEAVQVLLVPRQDGEQRPRPNWHAYYQRHFRIIRRMLPTLDDALIEASWSRDLDLFFIDRRFNRLDGNGKRAHELLLSVAGPMQVPPYADIQALTQGRAVSLPTICRLRYCLERARRVRHGELSFFFGLDEGIPIRPGRVIPSINVFDSQRYAEVKSALAIKEGELTAFASKALNRNLNRELFEGELERGYAGGKGGKSTGFYRLTDHTAQIVYDFLQSKAKPGYVLRAMNYYMPRDPTYGNGNGKWCRSLMRRHGNYWPS